MATKKRRKRRARRNQTRQRPRPVTDKDLEDIRGIADRMLLDLRRAVRICRDTGRSVLDEDLDEFWALVKYVENVQDGIVRLDNKNKTVFPILVEFPQASDDRSVATWKSLKGMRSRLAHAFDHIDHDILWDTVYHAFPKLQALLEVVYFARCKNGRLRSKFDVGRWMDLPAGTSSQELDGTNSIPAVVFNERGQAMCLRFGRIANDTVVIASTHPGFAMDQIELFDPANPASPPEVLWRPDQFEEIAERSRARPRSSRPGRGPA